MKKRHIFLSAVWIFIIIMLTSCKTTSAIQEIKEIPVDAKKIMTLELTGSSGTYTNGTIDISGNGYLIFDLQTQSGSVKKIGVKDGMKDKIICQINNPKTALYSSKSYEYRADREYTLSFVNAKELRGTITVYFVSE